MTQLTRSPINPHKARPGDRLVSDDIDKTKDREEIYEV